MTHETSKQNPPQIGIFHLPFLLVRANVPNQEQNKPPKHFCPGGLFLPPPCGEVLEGEIYSEPMGSG